MKDFFSFSSLMIRKVIVLPAKVGRVSTTSNCSLGENKSKWVVKRDKLPSIRVIYYWALEKAQDKVGDSRILRGLSWCSHSSENWWVISHSCCFWDYLLKFTRLMARNLLGKTAVCHIFLRMVSSSEIK